MNKAVEKLKEELLAVLPPTIFFFIALHIVGVVRALMTKGTGLPVASAAQIALGALIIGKAILHADLWPPINRFPEKPLIYNIVWKTVIYYVVASVFHYLERLYDFAKEAGGIVAGNEKLLSEIVWHHFWAIQIILLVVILNYCVIREMGRVLGEKRMIRKFFQQRAAASVEEREASRAPMCGGVCDPAERSRCRHSNHPPGSLDPEVLQGFPPDRQTDFQRSGDGK